MKSPQPDKRRKAEDKAGERAGAPAGDKSAKLAKAEERGKPPANKPPPVAFPKKNQPPTAAAFAARLPLSLGKRFEVARSFLLRQENIREDVYFYGPKTGWALRYLLADQPLCSLLLHGDTPVAIVSLDAATAAAVDWKGLSPVGQLAHKHAHGSPSLLWLDVPLAGTGAADLKAILRVKLATLAAD
jgi:hypothetical protein